MAIAATTAVFAAALAAGGPDGLVYLTEDYPPENYLEGGELKGYAVEILKAVWRKLGVPEQPIQVVPWGRGYHEARTEPNRVLFATARTAEREALFKWAGPIYDARLALFARPGAAPAVKDLEGARAGRVGVLIQDVCEQSLAKAGFEPGRLVKVRTLEQLVRMLDAGRLDLVCTTEKSLQEAATADPALAGPFVPVVELGAIRNFFAFSLSTDDAVVARLQRALEAIDAERRGIIRRYRLAP